MVFDKVYTSVAADASMSYVEVKDNFVEKTAKFPCVIVKEIENTSYQRTNTDDCAENHARLTYEISVYSDKKDTAKSECRKIINFVDGVMQSMKFRRTRLNEPLNISRTIFRQYARYSVIVAKGITSGNDTIYQMYRR